MALKLSTGLRNKFLSSNSFLSIFKDGFIEVRTGAQPTSPDDAPTGTLLFTIYSDGSSVGIEFSAAVSGVMGKASAETWSGKAVATGTAGWFRLKGSADTGAESTTEPRMDGACATSGGQLNMSSLNIVSGALQTISSFNITMPES